MRTTRTPRNGSDYEYKVRHVRCWNSSDVTEGIVFQEEKVPTNSIRRNCSDHKPSPSLYPSIRGRSGNRKEVHLGSTRGRTGSRSESGNEVLVVRRGVGRLGIFVGGKYPELSANASKPGCGCVVGGKGGGRRGIRGTRSTCSQVVDVGGR